MTQGKFSFCISTRNRCDHLIITLKSLVDDGQINQNQIFIVNDCSTDETAEKISSQFPDIHVVSNNIKKGYIHNRNLLFKLAATPFAVFLDDDANFIGSLNFEAVEKYFDQHKQCAILAPRIYWGLSKPLKVQTIEKVEKVKSFVGCSHIWRLSAWNEIPDYPEWYKFYGEEDFASLQLLKKNWEIHYYPNLLVHHRVNVRSRKKDKDYIIRTRRALHAGWSNYLMFYPNILIPRKLAASIWGQMRNKVFKGDLKAFLGLMLAIFDVILNITKITDGSNRMTFEEFKSYKSLEETKIYWKP